jgi:hypothetical protein
MAIRQLIKKRIARDSTHISSEEGKDKITKVSSEILIALEKKRQD